MMEAISQWQDVTVVTGRTEMHTLWRAHLRLPAPTPEELLILPSHWDMSIAAEGEL